MTSRDTPGAVLWDMDGLLIDSEPLWTIAEIKLAAHYGALWTDDIKAQCIGMRMDAAVPVMLRAFGVALTPDAIDTAGTILMATMVELFAQSLPVLPGAADLLAQLHAARVPCALVSSSYRVLVDACLAGLSALGLPDFAVSLAGDEVAEAKPSPLPYLSAAKTLDVSTTRCVVLEDSVTGARAGVAAGCATVLVPGHTVPAPAVNEGWNVVASLSELSVERLGALTLG